MKGNTPLYWFSYDWSLLQGLMQEMRWNKYLEYDIPTILCSSSRSCWMDVNVVSYVGVLAMSFNRTRICWLVQVFRPSKGCFGHRLSRLTQTWRLLFLLICHFIAIYMHAFIWTYDYGFSLELPKIYSFWYEVWFSAITASILRLLLLSAHLCPLWSAQQSSTSLLLHVVEWIWHWEKWFHVALFCCIVLQQLPIYLASSFASCFKKMTLFIIIIPMSAFLRVVCLLPCLDPIKVVLCVQFVKILAAPWTFFNVFVNYNGFLLGKT